MAIDLLCILPCCKRKCATGVTDQPPYVWLDGAEPEWEELRKARQLAPSNIIPQSPWTSAIRLYTGNVYSAPGLKDRMLDQIGAGRLRVFVISAGYGLLDGLEPAQDYNAKMEGPVARYWSEHGLGRIIASAVAAAQPREVYGFFCGQPQWNYTGAKYRFFFTEGLHIALVNGFAPRAAGCFHSPRMNGLRNLGEQLNALLETDDREGFVARTVGAPQGKVHYDPLWPRPHSDGE